MKRLPRADKNALFKLISELMSCGFRGSAQRVVDENIDEYIRAQINGNEWKFKCPRCGCRFANEISSKYYCYNCNAEMP